MKDIAKALESPSAMEEKMLRLRFGIDDGIARSPEEVGREFNKTAEEIKNIEALALAKPQAAAKSEAYPKIGMAGLGLYPWPFLLSHPRAWDMPQAVLSEPFLT
jgi:hypothetical protein